MTRRCSRFLRDCFALRALAVSAASALTLGLLGLIWASEATAQQSYAQFVREANERTVRLLAGGPGDTALDVAHDMAEVMQCVEGLRIVPIAGRGGTHNIYDLLFLRGVDMAVIRADVLDYAARENIYTRDLKERIVYVAPLFQEELHLIADEDIQRVEDLQGKFVNVGPPGSLALAAQAVLEAAGVEAIVSKFDNDLALERVVDGGLDAMFVFGGQPIPLLSDLSDVPGLRLVPIPPLNSGPYQPALLTHADYPSLVRAGEEVETISVASILAVYNWPSDRSQFTKSELFTDVFFRRLNYLRRPARHPKWAETRLTSSVAGWTRFQPAQDRVDVLAAQSLAPTPEPAAASASVDTGPSLRALEEMFQKQLDEFGIVPPTSEERAQLFLAFKRRFEATNR